MVKSPPTDRFSPRRCRLSLAFIKKEQRRQKNGEKRLFVDDFSLLLSTNFSIKFQFSGPPRDPWYRSPETEFCPAAATARSSLLQQSGDEKRMVRIHCVLTISQFFHSPFFQLICYFQGCRAIFDIAADKWIFDRPPPLSAFVYYKLAATQKEWLEYIVFWRFYIFFTHLFSINLLFFGLSCDPWHRSPQIGFLPATIAARSRLLQQSADEKRTVRKQHILVIFQLFLSPCFN